jgi:hypothetical protein
MTAHTEILSLPAFSQEAISSRILSHLYLYHNWEACLDLAAAFQGEGLPSAPFDDRTSWHQEQNHLGQGYARFAGELVAL